ncbi:MAG: flagellar biosynthesis protein FlhF [Spirochaetota bacterium]
MKYVKLKAKNFNEALKELREKYGEDAIPISHKYLKEGGVFNTTLLAKEVVELTAAIHEPRQETRRPLKKSTFDMRVDDDVTDSFTRQTAAKEAPAYKGASFRQNFGFDPQNAGGAAEKPSGDDRRADANRSGMHTGTSHKAETVSTDQAAAYGQTGQDSAAVELTPERYDELKKFEKEFYEIKESLKKLADAQRIEQENREAASSITSLGRDDHMRSCIDILKNNDFTDEECSTVIAELKESMTQADMADQYKIEKNLKDLVKSRIITTGPVSFNGRKKVIMFVGPTGVGKTTSLAKLGAHLSLRENKKVVFITIDTYRIAATEQLKKYAEIMRIPIHVVSEPKHFRSVIDREDADVVLVDTSGRSHRNTMKISEIKNYADQVSCDLEKFLCVSATTKRNDLASIFSSFEPLDFDSVLITKVDETSFVGNVVKVADTYNKPISYIADGQEVPNNLHAACPETISEYMISGTVRG